MGMKKIMVRVPASIGNVGSGFDCAGLSLKFYNSFLVERSSKAGFELNDRISSESVEKTGELFMHAFNTCLKHLGKSPFNVKVCVDNKIPFRRGFGSSATVILGGIISAAKCCNCNVNKEDVLNMAVSIEKHIDNLAASLYGGFVFGSVINGRPVTVRIEPDKDLRVVAFIPDYELATEDARNVLPCKVPMDDAVHNICSFGFLCMAFALKDFRLLNYGTVDRLHQPYRKKLMPHLGELTETWDFSGIMGACLSGAGPSVVFFAGKKSAEEVRQKVAEKIKKAGLKGKVGIFKLGGRTSWKILT